MCKENLWEKFTGQKQKARGREEQERKHLFVESKQEKKVLLLRLVLQHIPTWNFKKNCEQSSLNMISGSECIHWHLYTNLNHNIYKHIYKHNIIFKHLLCSCRILLLIRWFLQVLGQNIWIIFCQVLWQYSTLCFKCIYGWLEEQNCQTWLISIRICLSAIVHEMTHNTANKDNGCSLVL